MNKQDESGPNRHTQQLVTTARGDGMDSRREGSDASSLAAHLEDETEDEERDRRDKHDNLDADPSKPGPGEDGVRRLFAIAVREARRRDD